LTARAFDGNEAHRVLWTTNVAPLSSLVLSLDGKILAAGERSGTVLLIDTNSGIVKERLFSPDGDTGPIESLAFAPDGRTLAIGAREQVRLWAIDGKPYPLVCLRGHRGLIRSLAFDTRGTRLARADEKTIKVWDLVSLRTELGRVGLDW
jgi:WD40 repeat protein